MPDINEMIEQIKRNGGDARPLSELSREELKEMLGRLLPLFDDVDAEGECALRLQPIDHARIQRKFSEGDTSWQWN